MSSGFLFNFATDENIVFGRYFEKGFAIEGLPVFYYVIFLAISWFYFWVTLYCSKVIPNILIRLAKVAAKILAAESMETQLTHYIDYLNKLRNYAAFTSFSLINLVAWKVMFPENTTKKSNRLTAQILTLILLASVIWTSEKFLLQIFSYQFHQRAFADRTSDLKMVSRFSCYRLPVYCIVWTEAPKR